MERNPDTPWATEEDRMQVKHDLLKQMIASTEYYRDSIKGNSK